MRYLPAGKEIGLSKMRDDGSAYVRKCDDSIDGNDRTVRATY